ncbi:CDC28 [Ecytonucleospora hepatopenaei]|uniref:CDC28 n=1 Tax=Ecytonucleospora hepatopenaei TaxID=646526 RepID=A0A1W0E5K9_9MICR|nr:CDC28 [Ecytonucleospora hepatopenaei]
MLGKKGNYRKIEKIGEGAYGTVYKAVNRDTNEVVALKKVKISEEDEGIPATTIREIILLKNLKHPQIVELLEIIHKNDKIYLVFEYLKSDLKKVMNENNTKGIKFTYKQILKISKQLLKAIFYCHSKNIFHRDIKPQNILVNNDFEIKLADFGLARGAAVPLRVYTQEIITLWYRPPELLLGKTYYDSSVDIWSIACIMYEMYTSEVLFQGTSEITQIHKIYDVLGVPNNNVWEGVENRDNYNPNNYIPKYNNALDKIEHIEFRDVLQKMLRYNPIERYSARELLDLDIFKKFQ